jgi:Tfp pilus assembly protein PilN
MNVFFIIGGVIAIVSLLLAAAVFGYDIYLKNARDQKSMSLAEAQKAVDLDTVEEFIRLKNRLSTVETLLNQHIGLSEFFDTLEARTLQTVRFSGLTVAVEDDRSAEINMEGVARSFNALAAQSSAIAAEKRIKRAIFSDISVNTNGTVGFTLTATLDPRLITSGEVLPGIPDTPANLPATTAPSAPVATSSPVSAPAAATTTRAASTTPTQP